MELDLVILVISSNINDSVTTGVFQSSIPALPKLRVMWPTTAIHVHGIRDAAMARQRAKSCKSYSKGRRTQKKENCLHSCPTVCALENPRALETEGVGS